MSKLAHEKYDATEELKTISLSIPDPTMRLVYKDLCRDLERHDLGISDDRKTAIRVKGADVKVKIFVASNTLGMKRLKAKRFKRVARLKIGDK